MRINSDWLNALLLLIGVSSASMASAQLTVFACEPEYASLVTELAPDAEVFSATTAFQDPHLVQARPSLIAKMRRADLAVCAGAELEIGWLPMLQMKSANPKVNSGGAGLFFAAEQTDTLDKLQQADRSMGDVHQLGNPHLHFSPARVLMVATALAERMAQLAPANAAAYQANLQQFVARWQKAVPQWQQQAAALRGKKVIGYHSSFRYLFDWLGIEQVADLEPKPGLPPSSAHLASLLTRAKAGDISAITVAGYQDRRGADWLAQRTGLPVVVLPMSVGGDEQSQDLFGLYGSVIQQLTGVIQ
ncbi:metal ABC transporter solute-binding protein, Zn/Mn family [Shewanella sp. GXUN23E]|uniref:metal ABC transporter solute-binding protein, Zn/Mn family n=1 Tax=Shewanella sp. GXUN23E TaxID=3422498 RepID=UPI003D7EA18D